MAGLLGEIFGSADVAKRKLKDVMANPVLSAQQFFGNINDRARNLNEMTAAAAREGVDYGPASQRLGGLLADAYNPMGLTVFHGSPAKFNKFDPTKIGTGEGAQAYGYGHYVAESPAVAKEYRTALSEPELFKKGRQIKTTAGSNMDTAKAWLQEAFDAGSANPFNDAMAKVAASPLQDKKQVMNALQKLQLRGVEMRKGGYEYAIDLPDDQIARMLDYDKPLSQQPESVRQAIKEYELDYVPENLTGGRLIEEMNKAFTPEMVAQHMRTAGIPGIRYLDQKSRGTSGGEILGVVKEGDSWRARVRVENRGGAGFDAPTQIITKSKPYKTQEEAQKWANEVTGQGTSNFVVFPGNENLLNIKKRNEDVLGLLD